MGAQEKALNQVKNYNKLVKNNKEYTIKFVSTINLCYCTDQFRVQHTAQNA